MDKPLPKGLIVALVVLIADQVSKWAILEAFLPDPRPVEILPVFNLVLTWNRGVSFGMFNDMGDYNSLIFAAIAVIISGVVLYWLKKAETKWLVLAYGLIIGGAIGNVIDRLRLDGVVDFLDFHWGDLHYPAFNIADSAIVVGAAIVILDALLRRGVSE